MNDIKKEYWEFEGDWYVQPKKGLPFCVNSEYGAEMLLDYLNNIEQKLLEAEKKGRIDELNKIKSELFTYQALDEKDNKRATTEAMISLRIQNRISELEKV